MEDGLEVDSFRRDEGKSGAEVEAELMTEGTEGSDSRPVSTGIALVADVGEKVEVLLHRLAPEEAGGIAGGGGKPIYSQTIPSRSASNM